jgi:putative transposase
MAPRKPSIVAGFFSPLEAARRCDAVQRWRRAMADGLTAEQAARAVGVKRATLYRWEEKPEPGSRRPHRPRGRQWTAEPARAVEELRNDNPMWGKRKIAVLLRREGFVVSISTIGRVRSSRQARRHCSRGPPAPRALAQAHPLHRQGALRPPPA